MEVQLKALLRLVRRGSEFVDRVLDEGLASTLESLRRELSIPEGMTDSVEVSRALRASRTSWWAEQRASYGNQALFGHRGQKLGNRWLNPECRFMGDGDRIRGLRLRANIYPTRYLTNRHAADPSARLCRRCHQADETAKHILQECPHTGAHLTRIERHNFIVKQVCRIASSVAPSASITQEKVLTSSDGVRLKPDIIVDYGDRVVIADVAITWDDAEGALTRMCNEKIAKYTPLRDRFGGRVVQVFGLSFGARSALCRGTVEGGEALGLTKGDLAWLSARALVGSLICLNRFTKFVV